MGSTKLELKREAGAEAKPRGSSIPRSASAEISS